MGTLLSTLAAQNRPAGEEIERQISSILALEALENEDIDDTHKNVFQQLKDARHLANIEGGVYFKTAYR